MNVSLFAGWRRSEAQRGLSKDKGSRRVGAENWIALLLTARDTWWIPRSFAGNVTDRIKVVGATNGNSEGIVFLIIFPSNSKEGKFPCFLPGSPITLEIKEKKLPHRAGRTFNCYLNSSNEFMHTRLAPRVQEYPDRIQLPPSFSAFLSAIDKYHND